MKKWIRRLGVGLFVFIVVIIVVVNVGMKAIGFSDANAVEYFKEKDFIGTIEQKNINGTSVKVVSDLLDDSDSILFVFVHGAPGTWDAFKDYITDEDFYTKGRVVAYDRPGYGGSGNRAMPEIRKQTDVLIGIIEEYKLDKVVLIGHSYGGPIVGLAAVDGQVAIDATIMIAPLVDPESEPIFWYSYFSYWSLTSWLLPNELVVAGVEKFAHAAELEKIKTAWQSTSSPIIHVHGLEDGLAPGKENLDFSKKYVPSQYLQTLEYVDKGHLVIWTDYKLTKAIILNAVNNL